MEEKQQPQAEKRLSDQPEISPEAPETGKDSYVPRTKGQLLAARIALVLFILFVIWQVWQIYHGFQ